MSNEAAAIVTREHNGLTIPTAGTFALDVAHSRVGFVARHMMVSKVRGSFGEFAGEVVVAENPLESSVNVTIQAASFTTNNEQRDGHVKTDEFLGIDTFPTITFVSTAVKDVDGNEFVLVGDLTIRGVTKQVELEVEFEGIAKSPWNTEVIGFSATTEIDREEFGMTFNATLETGGVLVSKKIKIEIEAEAIRA
ncbi:polyisoprenoid-binding protein [Longispora fulva]|uniref:Polyisoprenoid-binding protein YceI n=1 Tax=Longispora fulva TaxID=619741 RepID=A0A8J7KMV7_9ACTN|nr:YceI family protein [Longispora fulva]MBG6139581.1 polyisoprenoid-binding protein YceI [Longispora fulva]GIG58036.1 polyisoprenoid-binding protein [Longispora fulva]